MLVIVDKRELDPERLLQRIHKSVDRAVAFPFNRHDRAVRLAQRRDEARDCRDWSEPSAA